MKQMKRIWFLWLAAGYVVAHVFIVPLQIYCRLWWAAGVSTVFTVVVGRMVWTRRGYFTDPREYE
jgi:hypothetical protein